ncbi:DNA-directed RNA polymerase II subunit GRINL1A-like [Neocloeon triangulifer]|uniref:DNA-directed RNA polymerase II subunit GRINL1A-like n=1 Tax=Neocloeon triangulifer TaxID=2078957 RepID=UPI00286F28E4|nr:DNA-directed RNA polymerase II subunit GRINL1A-like [Neocloeon triangulifer]
MDPSNVFVRSANKDDSEGQIQKREMHDLKAKNDAQLRELLERQERILGQKGLVAKLADKGEKVRNLKSRIEEELAHRVQINALGGNLTKVNLGENMEWNVAEGETTKPPQELASDPLLNYLQLRKESVEPFVENMCTKIESNHQVEEKFLPHRSNEAPIKSPGGKSPRPEGIENHAVKEIPIKDSLFLQRKQAQASVPKSAAQLTQWRQMADMMDSEESEDEYAEQKEEEEMAAIAELEEDPPGVPDFK